MRPALVALGLLAGVAATVAVRRRRGGDGTATPRAITAVRRGHRNRTVATLATRRAADRGMTAARARLVGDADRRRLRAELERREAEDVVAALGEMKGAMMKLGQMASYLDEGLPEPMRAALAELRSDAPPMPSDLALTEIERGLGRPLSEMFADLDPTPLAAASIGQVHRAVTLGGDDVVVKVQYPEIGDAIAADLDNTDTLATMLALVYPGLDPELLVAELRERVTEELDYRLEARNQQQFVDDFAGHPTIRIPQVHHELSARRVLTSEFIDGERFEAVYERSDADKAMVAETIYRFVFRSLNQHRVFNGDPHAGNYLLASDGRVAFLDFGFVRRFESAEIEMFSELIQAMIAGDHHAFRATAERVEVLRPGAPFSDEEVFEWFTAYYELILEDRPVLVTPEYSGGLVRKTFDARSNQILRHTNVPPSFALIQRINLGLFSILADLGAEANWRRISEELWPFTDGAPSTPMGEAEARWLAERSA